MAAVVESRTSLADKVPGLDPDAGVTTAVGDGLGDATGVGRGVAVVEDGDGTDVLVGALVGEGIGDTGVSMADTGVGLAADDSSPHADRKAADRHSRAKIATRRSIARDQTSNATTPHTNAFTTALNGPTEARHGFSWWLLRISQQNCHRLQY